MRRKKFRDLIFSKIIFINTVAFHRFFLIDVIILIEKKILKTKQRWLCRAIRRFPTTPIDDCE